ncbi:MAG: glycosyltransferase [Clostridia bacterium]|nr:glycosyltransferase [Clostridia bacterium]
MLAKGDHKIPVSVIIPLYNGEKYIENCLRSIQDQSMKELEIIVVNDGSTDSSAKIVAKLAKEDPRIMLCNHPENMGLFQARLTGVNASHGDYIAFVDADDAVSFDWFRLLYQKATETQSDITIGQFLCDQGNNKYTFFNLDPLRQKISLQGEEVFRDFVGQEGNCYSWHLVWNKLYARALWMDAMEDLEAFSKEHLHFIMCEDIAFSAALWVRAKKVRNVQSGAYYYYNRANDASSTSAHPPREKTLVNIKNVVNAFKLMEMQMKKLGLCQEDYKKHFYEWKLHYARMYFNILKDDSARNKKNDEKLIQEAFQTAEGDDVTDYKATYHYFYSQETVVDYTLLTKMEDAKKMICSEEKQAISFDIFDTLILRPFLYPTDLFFLMNDEFNRVCKINSYLNFVDIRVNSEQNCRGRIRAQHVGYEEITLDEIYEQIAIDYPFDKEALDYMKALEQELEVRFCVQRKAGKELFELARMHNKKIIVCSDMYLPRETVDAILKKNGYAYDELYLSSELRVAKCTTNLFRHVQKELHLPKRAFLHFGDNWESDVLCAQRSGWDAIHLPKATDSFRNWVPGVYNGEAYARIFGRNGQMKDVYNSKISFFGYRCALALAANKLYDDPFQTISTESDYNADPYRLGYFALGHYLYAITDWIIQHAKEANAGHVHFVARDGYLPMEAYRIFKKYDPTLPEENYLYVSRKALALADVYAGGDLYSLWNKMNISNSSPYKLEAMLSEYYVDGAGSIQDKLGLNDVVFKRKFSSQDEFHRVVKVLAAQLDPQKLIEQKKELKEHFKEEFKPGDLMFDIGYSGRVEAVLSKLLQYPVNSLYVHSNNDSVKNRERINGFKNNCFYDYKPAITGVVREHVFMKPAPSTVGYEKKDGKLLPIFETYKTNPGNEIATRTFQGAALEFVEDMLSVFDGFVPMLAYHKDDMASPFESYLHYSKPADRKIFGCVWFEDDMGMGKMSALDFWNQETKNFGLDKRFALTIDEFDGMAQEFKLCTTFKPYPKWKKALCYFILDRNRFWARLKVFLKRNK